MSDHDADAAHLVELYDAKWAIVHENAMRPSSGPDRLTGAHLDAVLEAGRVQDEACEAFRRRYYPRRAQVCVGLRMVFTRSASGRSVQTVFDPERVAS